MTLLNPVENNTKIAVAMKLIEDELRKAMSKHGPQRNGHEAFGVIYEEFNVEFAEALHANNAGAQKHELVQVGAMAARALVDIYL